MKRMILSLVFAGEVSYQTGSELVKGAAFVDLQLAVQHHTFHEVRDAAPFQYLGDLGQLVQKKMTAPRLYWHFWRTSHPCLRRSRCPEIYCSCSEGYSAPPQTHAHAPPKHSLLQHWQYDAMRTRQCVGKQTAHL